MSWLWETMNKPRLEVTMMDELKIAGFCLLVLVGAFIAWRVVSSWFERIDP